jgi:hypothetical protein
MPLLTYADLTAPSLTDPSKTFAVVSVERMQSTTSPMPPSPNTPASSAELSAFEEWVTSGTPTEDCSGDAGPTSDAQP